MSEDEAGTLDVENVATLKELFSGFDLEVTDGDVDYLLLTTKKPVDGRRKGRFVLPKQQVGHLAEQASRGPRALSDHYGFFTNDGYFELELGMFRAGRNFGDSSTRPRYARLSSTETYCAHRSNPLPAVYPAALDSLTPDAAVADESDSEDAYEDIPRPVDRPNARRIHVYDENDNCCIELSPASPCGIVFGSPKIFLNSNGFSRRFDVATTLKIQIDAGRGRADFLRRAHDIANAFLYELSVRNGLRYDPIYRPSLGTDLPLRQAGHVTSVRLPRISIPAEVAQLYAFGESAEQNPPLAFLSFYQVLEYYFPRAVKRILIRDFKKELINPRFDGTDDNIVKLIGIAEKGQSVTEDKQIKILLESLDGEVIREFFEAEGRAAHFGGGGPILGVNSINPKNTKDPIIGHVASRIYALRNRIVHAKDDPKYQAKILLPRSREAAQMRPDVDLVKFLAQQVIVDSQV